MSQCVLFPHTPQKPSVRCTFKLSLHKPNKGLNKLNKRLLTFVGHLRAWCGGLGLGGRKDAASWRWWRSPTEVARQAGQKGALEAKHSTNLLESSVNHKAKTSANKSPWKLCLTSSELSSCLSLCLSRGTMAGSLRYRTAWEVST